MVTNPLSAYYLDQARTGQVGGNLNFFKGERYQKGHGFGSIISGLLPLLKKSGKNLFDSGLALASDIASGGEVKSAIKHRGLEAAKRLAKDTCHEITQSGSGLRKRRRRTMLTTRTIRRPKRKRVSKNSLNNLLGIIPKRRKRKAKRVSKKSKRK